MRRREVLYCELCGAPIEGKAYHITVEGIELIVCERCYKNYISRSRRTGEDLRLVQSRPSVVGPRERPVTRAARTSRQQRIAVRPPSLPALAPKTRPRRGVDERVAERYEVVPDFAMRVKRARERLGLTQRELAQKVKESERVIRRIEAGTLRPTVDLAKRLERVLGIKLLEPVVEGEVEGKKEGEDYLTLGDIADIRG